MDSLKIGERVFEDGVITEGRLQRALIEQKRLNNAPGAQAQFPLGIVFMKLGYVPEKILFKYIFEPEKKPIQ